MSDEEPEYEEAPAPAPAPTPAPIVIAAKPVAKKTVTAWNTVGDVWPSHLPRPPSRSRLSEEDKAWNDPGIPKAIVFQANTNEGASLVRVLANQGMKVIAVVRVFTSKNAKALIQLKNVDVRVVDQTNFDEVSAAARGCRQAFLITKYWERFETTVEEQVAKVVVAATADAGVKRLVLASFEDIYDLISKGRKSQLVPAVDGKIYPKFDGMAAIDAMAKSHDITLTQMFTSYFDEPGSKKSLILVRHPNGKIVSQSHFNEK